ncbi:MAG: bifunctional 23S rRNA (guanine(2069)-N(7))-methyltransferase RlmK/23S rRNA (guanine(2445)-N(2))-methyltransferase RlmL [Proteobacteria bacterium]|nr:bifunctional 23S rRNA (guanine(2069)-N(7))-methyltransferase RlmK/23S rRNA (guanine(2445)-N(2))-methyltransferase RlmL [Pseudomonadota bacterium]
MNALSLFATAPNGMSDLLTRELEALGASSVSETRAGVRFEGSLEDAYRACLWSRLANRILLPLGSFPADSPEALYAGVREIDWLEHLSADQTIAVDVNVSHSAITHSHYAALKVKDAIVDNFTATGGPRPSVDIDRPDIRINGYVLRDQAAIYLDLSGSSLHQRNYRLGAGVAPLKENLAAAILLRARWPEIAAERGAFADPMCGSGTLVIEAAMMAADMAPGLHRTHFGFLAWKQHDQALWEELINEAGQRARAGVEHVPVMLGFDHNRRVLELARSNADRAGLGDRITFIYQDLFDFRHDFPARGLMVTNPPYGVRMNESGELPGLYQALGAMMKNHLRGWQGAIFTEDQSLGKHIGMRAGKLHTLYNGAIACKLIHFTIEASHFYRQDRLPQRIDEPDWSEQARMFKNRLTKNLKPLARWARREDVTCYRAYDADLPDFSAAIDVYHSADNPMEVWVCVQEYEAPSTIDEGKAKLRTRELVSVVQDVFELEADHLFYKMRGRQRGDTQYERMSSGGDFHQVREGNCLLRVNFESYLDTGLFLDHRPLRLRLQQEAAGRDFLNLFGYTGAATVHAAQGGAASTTTVDMSRTYIEWAKQNLRANGFEGGANHLIQEDCLQWLRQERRPRFDLILLDPPSFSNSKRMSQSFDVQEDHAALIEQCMRLLRKGGTLYFSTNLRHFRLASEVGGQYECEDISRETIPHDFKRRQNIHHCWRIVHR